MTFQKVYALRMDRRNILVITAKIIWVTVGALLLVAGTILVTAYGLLAGTNMQNVLLFFWLGVVLLLLSYFMAAYRPPTLLEKGGKSDLLRKSE